MREEAAKAGFYIPEYFPDKKYQKLQIYSIEELLNGNNVQYPQFTMPGTFKQAVRKGKSKHAVNGNIFDE